MKKNVVLVKVNNFFIIFIGYHNNNENGNDIETNCIFDVYSVDGYKDNCELEIELREELTTASSEPCTRNSQRVNG